MKVHKGQGLCVRVCTCAHVCTTVCFFACEIMDICGCVRIGVNVHMEMRETWSIFPYVVVLRQSLSLAWNWPACQ